MSVKIRLRRTGANNDVSYRVVATDSRSPRDGKFIEVLGWYDPKKKGVNYQLKMERIQHWTSMGAIVSDTVASLIKKVPAAPVAAPAEK
ncbi:MAG: 30S ribosomal protein S16 [Kiritimatiellia bacterium]